MELEMDNKVFMLLNGLYVLGAQKSSSYRILLIFQEL